MINPGDAITHLDMCREEGASLQRGMNFHIHKHPYSIVLMSVRKGAPYEDQVKDNGRTLIYKGHDVSKKAGGPEPKTVDQPTFNPNHSRTQNGLFYQAAKEYKSEKIPAEMVRVYEKIQSGMWVYNGIFRLLDAWRENSRGRKVFKFHLEIDDSARTTSRRDSIEIDPVRIIPSHVKQAVWKRDKGQCVKCGKKTNLHFDHRIPYSKGGSSFEAGNIQLLCSRHNLEKRDRIE